MARNQASLLFPNSLRDEGKKVPEHREGFLRAYPAGAKHNSRMQKANFSYERKLWKDGLSIVAGVDEVGRGAWAGPLLAAAVVFPSGARLKSPLQDSKLLTSERRIELAKVIREQAFAFAFGQSEVSLIERCGIAFATEYAMLKALEGLGLTPDFTLIDFFRIRSFPRWQQEAIKKGDQLSASIAAASILAKVERDRLMTEFDPLYPEYGFGSHKGYGTKVHQEAIRRFGTVPIHRKSFIPEALRTF